MRHIIATVLVLCMLFGLAVAGEKRTFKNDQEKVSYSIGYQVGSDFKRQQVNINPEILVKGIEDGLADVEPQLSHDEMRTTLIDLKKRIAAAEQEKMQALAVKNLAAGKTYLAENAKKEGVKTLASGLQYKVLAEGTGASPKATDTVTVNYRGTLIDGTEFDSSYKRGEPATFRVDRVIPGWTEALQLMKEGTKWQLFIPADLAYGERSAGPIEPNSTLIFEVELIAIKQAE